MGLDDVSLHRLPFGDDVFQALLILVPNPTRFVLCVNGEKRITDVRGNDGLWHLVCVTWSGAQGGAWRLFVDGALKDSGVDLAPGAIITGLVWETGQDKRPSQEEGGFS